MWEIEESFFVFFISVCVLHRVYKLENYFSFTRPKYTSENFHFLALTKLARGKVRRFYMWRWSVTNILEVVMHLYIVCSMYLAK